VEWTAQAFISYKKAQCFPDQTRSQRDPGRYRISLDTTLFRETIVHFYSSICYRLLHAGRWRQIGGLPSVAVMSSALSRAATGYA
jgi:hypothetical protein